jgi:hypothetical protein
MRSVEFKTPLRVIDTTKAGGKRERRVSSVTEAEADWQWVQPGCLQIKMWGSADAKAKGKALLDAGKPVIVDVYQTPASNVLQFTLPATEIKPQSAIARPSPIIRPH